MQRFLMGFAFLVLLLAPVAATAADADVKAILDKAIKAHGGEEILNKFPGVRLKMTAKFTIGTIPVTGGREFVFLAPDKYKQVNEGVYLGQPFFSSWIIDGNKAFKVDKGKTVEEGKPTALGEPYSTALKDDAHLMRVLQLTPLQGTGFEVSLLEETKVEGRLAVGLRARAKGQRDLNLFFDKESGLLVKSERRAVDLGTLKEVAEERLYLDYKQPDGQPFLARKVIVKYDGKDHQELELTEGKFLEKIDPREFAR